MRNQNSWWDRLFNHIRQHFLTDDQPVGVHFQNHFRSQPVPQATNTPVQDPSAKYVVNPQDLPRTVGGKLTLFVSIIRKLVLIGFVTFLLIIGLGAGIGSGYLVTLISKEPIPTYTSLKNQIEKTDQSTTLYFDNNVPMDRVLSDTKRIRVNFDQISPYMKKAIVATEDENFYEHHGVVPKSVIRAIISEITGYGTQTGGSTLTQQLVKMQILSSETTWKRKATEILLATRLEKHFSKDQILESYLNVVPLGLNNQGQNIAGVQAAAQGIFNTNAKDLTLAQAAFIAGLPQSPSVYTPFDQHGNLKSNLKLGLERKNTVLFRMYRHGDISKKQYLAAKKVDLRSQFKNQAPAPKAHIKYGYLYNMLTAKLRTKLMHQLARENNIKYSEVQHNKDLYQVFSQKANRMMSEHDYQIHSTIDKNLYDNMQTAFAKNADLLGTTHHTTTQDPNTGATVKVTEPVQNGSVLLDNKTGAVLGFVGGQDFKQNQLNHAFDTLRSPGSSIKPMLVYAPAVERGIIGSKTMLADFKAKFGKYKPTDFDDTVGNKFVPADKALEQSLNIPAVHLYDQVLKKVNPRKYMDKMGLKLSNKEYRELGISLGGTRNGFSVLQEASAFSTFANQGVHVNPYYIAKITDVNNHVIYQHHTKKQRVFQPGTSYIMQQMMHGVIEQGTASSLTYQLDFDYKNAFGKTGTSNDFRDNWFVGSTAGVTMATWMGYDNLYRHNYDLDPDSTETNQTTWANLMNSVYQTKPELLKEHTTMKRPDTVNAEKVLRRTGTLPGSINYEGYQSQINTPTTTSLFFKTHAKPLSKHFGIGGKDKNYRLFWNNYFGADNGYGITQYLDEKKAKSPSKRHTNGLPDSIIGNYVPESSNNSSLSNSESENSFTNSMVSGTGGTGTDNSEPSLPANETTESPATPATTTPPAEDSNSSKVSDSLSDASN
ncbi:penicillin-binding protein [Bombilactobacillus folatiphilus]|uniref:Penicillin-binding protein n=1 Tax=Bombilactobacillus folatiphilus TaxID=2923362 RepID=A0ABY4PB24_9LACO|nr:transglycosylase domain-containing protein [Bombilactobacillus folatiphilus]UQS82482.1 penicillin-binding protein [Bombilactobacillus folatiphilus]